MKFLAGRTVGRRPAESGGQKVDTFSPKSNMKLGFFQKRKFSHSVRCQYFLVPEDSNGTEARGCAA